MSTQRYLGRWSKKDKILSVQSLSVPLLLLPGGRAHSTIIVQIVLRTFPDIYITMKYFQQYFMLEFTSWTKLLVFIVKDTAVLIEKVLMNKICKPRKMCRTQCLSCQEFYLARFAAMSADRVGLGFFIGQTCALDSTFCTHPGMFLCLARILCISFLYLSCLSFVSLLPLII